MESSFRLLRVRGIDIGANWSMIFMFLLVVYSLATSVLPVLAGGLSGAEYWAMALIATALFYVTLILHELGHAFRAQKDGMHIEGITLWIFGGVAKFRGIFPNAGAEFRIAIAGPLVTLVLIVMFGALDWVLRAANGPAQITGVTGWLWQVNLTLLVFNMVPALPLDGGRVLRSFLWGRHGDFVRATMTAARIARMFAGGMIAIGLFFLVSPTPPSNGLILAFLGWFLLQAARAEESYALFRQTLGGLRVRDLMTPSPQTVHPEMSVASFIDDVAHLRGHSTYPVIDPLGTVTGLVSLRLAASVPFEERLTKRVGDVMVPRAQIPVVSPSDDLTEIVPMLQQGTGRAVVVEHGALVGILSLADVVRAIEVEKIRQPIARERGGRRGGWVVLGLLALGLLAYLYSPPFVVFAPGAAFDVTQDVRIKGADTDEVRGKYLLTSVAVQQPNVIGLVSAMIGGEPIAPLSQVIPSGVDSDEFFEAQEELFEQSETTAAAAAAQAAGLEVESKGTGAIVGALAQGSPAARVLEQGDVITRINGNRVRLADEVVRTIRSRPSGSQFRLEVEREKRTRKVTVRSQRGIVEGAPGIGAFLETRDLDVGLPFDIRFRKREIGGPSAGLTYALAVYDLLTKGDLAEGRTIATTGTIDLDGRVGPIGGIEEKAEAAKDAGADLFLVPESEVDLARGSGLEVIGVSTLEDAIRVLERSGR